MIFVWGGEINVTLATIYQVSKAALDTGDAQANMAVVAKHYFTHEKGKRAAFLTCHAV